MRQTYRTCEVLKRRRIFREPLWSRIGPQWVPVSYRTRQLSSRRMRATSPTISTSALGLEWVLISLTNEIEVGVPTIGPHFRKGGSKDVHNKPLPLQMQTITESYRLYYRHQMSLVLKGGIQLRGWTRRTTFLR